LCDDSDEPDYPENEIRQLTRKECKKRQTYKDASKHTNVTIFKADIDIAKIFKFYCD